MKRLALIVLLCLLSFLSFADEFCDELLQVEKEMNESLPKNIDETTKLIQIRVNCDNKSFTYVKQILVDASLLANGWQERKQRQHTQLHCNNEGLSSVSGLTARDIIYSKDMDYLVTLITVPNDCK